MTDLAATIDHTLLKPDGTLGAIDVLCDEAMRYGFASVCVLPYYIDHVAARLAGSRVAACTVVGFPLGGSTITSKAAETADAVRRGAREIDMVAALPAIKNGAMAAVLDDIRCVTDVAHAGGAIVKVIIETCLLTDDEKRACGALVTEAGADFIKTSTGFSTGGATEADVALLRSAVGSDVRVKASGGIRDRATALRMLAAGAERLGTSSGVAIVGDASADSGY